MVGGYCMGKIPIISHQPISKTSGERGCHTLHQAGLFVPLTPPVPSLEDSPGGVAFPGLQVGHKGGAGDTAVSTCVRGWKARTQR